MFRADWVSCVFEDVKNDKIIGEFFFTIGFKEKIFSITPNSLKDVFDDIKVNKKYDYELFLQKSNDQFLDEKKAYDIGIYLLIVMFIFPALIGIFIIK